MRKLALVSLFILGLSGGTVYYYWSQATRLPEWYTSQKPNSSSVENVKDAVAIQTARDEVFQKIEKEIQQQQLQANSDPSLNFSAQTEVAEIPFSSAQTQQENLSGLPTFNVEKGNKNESLVQRVAVNKEVNPVPKSSSPAMTTFPQKVNPQIIEFNINEQELNTLVVGAIADDSRGKTLLNSVQGINTEIKQDAVEIGTVINPSTIPIEQLNPRQQEILKRALQTFPRLGQQDIYVGIEGNLNIENGRVLLSEDAKIKVGNMRLPLRDLAQRLGIQPQELQQALNLNLTQLNVQDIELNDSGASIRGYSSNQ